MRNKLMLILTICSTGLFARPFYIAHRGASFLAPENTVAAARLAWELGADAVEIDIHLSSDNRVMVIHDKDTKRICKGEDNMAIKSASSVDLRRLDAGIWKGEQFKGEKIPFLSEIIETVPAGKILVVEIKCGSEVIPAMKECIEKSGKADQIVFISFGWETIIDARAAFPGNKCYWLSSDKSDVKKKTGQVAKHGLTGVDLHYSVIDRRIVRSAARKGLEVLAWTVDDPAEAERLIGLGVNKITTNRPAWLREQTGKQTF
jgi:glycerophosphoryl diester phosphodiesterase